MNSINSIDEAFLRKLHEVVEEHISNDSFGADDLAKYAGISRSHIHRRLKTVTNQSISHFIRNIRLKKAMEMLRQTDLSISEIAYNVGFASPAYFNRCFHEQFGYPPGEIRKNPVLGPETQMNEADIDLNADSGHQTQPDEDWIFRHRKLISVFSVFILMLIPAYIIYDLFIQGKIATSAQDKSIIVLPFSNLTDNPDNQYFADGIMEDILNRLLQISDINVVSRSTSAYFRGTSLEMEEIVKLVDVRYVLTGSVSINNNKTSISVQLIDARRDRRIWSENFERALIEIMDVQNEIALKVARQLNVVLPQKGFYMDENPEALNHEAYDNYLRGRFLLHKANSEQRYDTDREALISSLSYFTKAIEADSSFVPAYAGLATAWFNLSAWGWYQPYAEGIENAKKFTAKALALDPDCAKAHVIKGAYLIWPERRFKEGQKELQLALRLDPNYSYAHQAYAQLLMITGPIEEARRHIDQCLALEPYFWVVHNLNAWICYFEGNYRNAVKSCLLARDLKSDFLENNWLMFLNYAKLGDGQHAKTELQSIAEVYYPAKKIREELDEAFKSGGIAGLFKWLVETNKHNPVRAAGFNGHPYYLAWWNVILGEKENAIFWLQKNMESSSRLYIYFNLIAQNPDFDPLRNDPRFLAIIEEIGLKPYHHRLTR